MDTKTIIRILKEHGWQEVRSKGSHVTFKHPEKRELVTVSHPQKDVHIETLKRIERQAGIKFRGR